MPAHIDTNTDQNQITTVILIIEKRESKVLTSNLKLSL